MSKKQFKAESKKLLDMMINSIYTNPEIFLRELISNASDAIDKLYYRSLTDKSVKVKKDKLEIWIKPNKEERTITITDNGCGMTKVELEENLGTIAKSGSELFKENNDKSKDISIIGQFGVGFYSSFMVAEKVTVDSLSVDSNKSYLWTSTGVDGYAKVTSRPKSFFKVRTFPIVVPTTIGSPILKVPFCTKSVATVPIFLSRRDSITVPIA